MAVVTARDAPLVVANARRSPRCGCPARLDRDVSGDPLGHARSPRTLQARP